MAEGILVTCSATSSGFHEILITEGYVARTLLLPLQRSQDYKPQVVASTVITCRAILQPNSYSLISSTRAACATCFVATGLEYLPFRTEAIRMVQHALHSSPLIQRTLLSGTPFIACKTEMSVCDCSSCYTSRHAILLPRVLFTSRLIVRLFKGASGVL